MEEMNMPTIKLTLTEAQETELKRQAGSLTIPEFIVEKLLGTKMFSPSDINSRALKLPPNTSFRIRELYTPEEWENSSPIYGRRYFEFIKAGGGGNSIEYLGLDKQRVATYFRHP